MIDIKTKHDDEPGVLTAEEYLAGVAGDIPGDAQLEGVWVSEFYDRLKNTCDPELVTEEDGNLREEYTRDELDATAAWVDENAGL